MKTLQVILLGLLVAGGAFAGENLSEADQKWSVAVEKMIAAGSATITTPSEPRAQLAVRLAKKAGRKADLERAEKGFRVKVS